MGDIDLGPMLNTPSAHAKHNSSSLKSDLESAREFGRLQGGLFLFALRTTDHGSTQGRPAVRVDPRSTWVESYRISAEVWGASAGRG